MAAGVTFSGRQVLYVGITSSVTAFDLSTHEEIATIEFSKLFHAGPVAMMPYQGDLWVSDSELRLLDGETLCVKSFNKLSGTGFGVSSLHLLQVQNGAKTILIDGHHNWLSCVDLTSANFEQIWKIDTKEPQRIPSLLDHAGVLYAGAGGFVEAFEPSTGRHIWTHNLKGLDYGNVVLASIFKTANLHSSQLITIEASLRGH